MSYYHKRLTSPGKTPLRERLAMIAASKRSGLVSTPSTLIAPATALSTPRHLLFDDGTNRKPYERELRKRPELADLSDDAIRSFLRNFDEYQRGLTEDGHAPATLRSVIHPLLLPSMQRFLRNVYGPAAATLPSDDELARGALITVPSADGPEYEPDSITAAEHWDQLVMTALQTAAGVRARENAVSIEDVESVIRVHLHWNVRERLCAVALNQFLSAFTVLDVTYGIRQRLPDGGESGKRLCRMLTSRLEPIAFRKHVSELATIRNVNSYDAWFDLITELSMLYNGIMMRTATSTGNTNNATAYAPGAPPRGGAGGKQFNTKQRQVILPRADGSATVRAFAANTSDGRVAGPAAFKSNLIKRKSPGAPQRSGPPPSPCPICGEEDHWARECPHRQQRMTATDAATAPATGPTPPPIKRIKGMQAGDHNDGVTVIGNDAIHTIIDTGASKTLINSDDADQLARKYNTITVIPLSSPLTVETAADSALECTYKIVTPASLVFNSGELAELQLLELYAVKGMRRGEILLGRSTLHSLGIDIVTMTKSALLAKTVAAIDIHAQAAADNEDISLVAAAKRASLSHADTADDIGVTDNTDDRMPDIAPHDPADVAATLEANLQAARSQGLSEAAITKLRAAITGPLANVFRNVFSDDPPAKVTPVKVEMTPAIFELRTPPVRRYSREGSQAMSRIMTRLERFKYVYRNSMATIVSPAYPVAKPKCDPSAPLEDRYRLTVDLRAVNACTVPMKFPLPRLETFMERVAGKKFWGSLDLFGGFWQVPLHEDSQRYFSILTDAGIWTPTRLIQGSRNAAGPFQAVVSEALGDALNSACIQYQDDVMVLAVTEDEFVDNWITVLERLDAVGLKVSAKKTQFYSKELKYCGRLFTPDGAKFDTGLISALTNMSPPTMVDELRSYLATTNWLRSSIPRYAETVQPLQDMLTYGLAMATALNVKPSSVSLRDCGWNSASEATFNHINNVIGHSVTLAYPSDALATCVFTDASDTHWAGVVTQVPREQLSLPVAEQSHQPLAFVSGAFSGASTRWPTVEKEAYAILETVLRMEHVLRRPDGFTVFTDHNNLKFLFSLDPATFNGRRAAADRIERWAIVLRSFTYDIHHIPGTDNILADLLTRWGAAPRTGRETAFSGNSVSHHMVTRHRARQSTPIATTSAASPIPAASADTVIPVPATPATPVAHTAPDDVLTSDALPVAAPRVADPAPTPLTTAVAARPLTVTPKQPWNSFAHDTMVQFDVDDAPQLSEIARAQATLRKTDIATMKLRPNSTDQAVELLVDSRGKVFVPDINHLRLRLCIAAHQGLGGHRGSETTQHWLTSRFTWPTVTQDIRTVCFACLHCLKTKGGKTIPRPRLHIPAAHAPNEVIHFDYIYIRADANAASPQYVLMIVDGFSRFVWMTPHRTPNAEGTARALLQWFALFGVVKSWVSDQGSHFLNEVVDRLRDLLGANHRFTTAYAPWSNGLVERVGNTLVETLSALTSESKRPATDWPLLLPVVNHCINHSPSSALGGKCPITGFTGRAADSPLDVILDDSSTATRLPLTSDQIKARVASLESALSTMIDEISAIAPRTTAKRPGQRPVDFGVGDYVLVARALRGVKDKTAPRWGGPGLVISAVNALSFTVRDLLSGKDRVIHAEHLKRYADSSLVVTPQLRAFIAANAVYTRVEAITGHRKKKGAWSFRVKWSGFEDDEDDTWEPMHTLCQDVPELLKRYAKAVQDPVVRTELMALVALTCATLSE
jgi:hypothetical protein